MPATTLPRTAVGAPELPREAWLTAGIEQPEIDPISRDIVIGEDPYTKLRSGIRLVSTRVHTDVKPREDDFAWQGFIPGRHYVEVKGTSGLRTVAELGNAIMAIDPANHGYIEVEEMIAKLSANSASLSREPVQRTAWLNTSLSLSLTNAVIDFVAIANGRSKQAQLHSNEATIVPFSVSPRSRYSSSGHLLIANVAVDDTFMDLL